MTILPDKPSELIRLALSDLEKVENDSRYVVEMNNWHKIVLLEDGKIFCAVCFAGAVMAKTINTDINATEVPWNFYENYNKLYAIDSLRVGNIKRALHELKILHPEGLEYERYIPDYKDYPNEFKLEMENLAEYLESFEL